MGSQYFETHSLPPLVEGTVHGYLKCVIDEVIWTKRNPGNVSILASWWGESDNAVFRPIDARTGNKTVIKNNKDIIITYAIKTNFDLFKEYLTNCEVVELTVIADKSHQIIGKAYITDLLEIFTDKSYFQYFPICNELGCKLGDVQVTLKLTTAQKNKESLSKFHIFNNKHINSNRFLKEIAATQTNISQSNIKFNTESPPIYDNIQEDNRNIDLDKNVYHSILRDKRMNSNNTTNKTYRNVTDQLVAQVVAKAQKLRGEMCSDTNDDDPLVLHEYSKVNSIGSDDSAENEATLYEYFMGKQMSRRNEKKALKTLRSHSPTPSLVDFAAETIQSCVKNIPPSPVECNNSKDHPAEEISNDLSTFTNRISIQRKQACPMDYVDSLRVIVDILTLNSAGYRRVKSSCLSRGDSIPVSVTYIVQYDSIVSNMKKLNKKLIHGSKPMKMCSKKQDGQIIYFNHEAIYDLPKSYLHMDVPLKFKIYNRHVNQRTPTELGIGSIYVSDVIETPYLSSTQRLAIVKKGIKVGELKVTIELGCDKIHFGKQFVEAVTSAKENIPVLELSSNSVGVSNRSKSATSGDESKSNSRTSAPTEKRENTWSIKYSNSSDKKINDHGRRNDGRTIKIDHCIPSQDKTLLHALIYIGEGKNLSATSTYLICRAFWREDRAFSRICTNTNNPFYHFHQLIPLIYDQQLLTRTKDNCIITEVYSKHLTSNDNLLGIAKLSVHQLYVAYRDPLVLPHLLKSKYPVTSVDGWVSITDPVTGVLCGELSALVALGTADQIALLEMTRGLRDSSVTPQLSRNASKKPTSSYKHCSSDIPDPINTDDDIPDSRTGRIIHSHGLSDNLNNAGLPNIRTQECQTEISTVNYFKRHETDETNCQRDENAILHAIVDPLAQALHVPKTNTDQSAQTELELPTHDLQDNKKVYNIASLCLDASNSNSFSGNSCNSSPRENLNMSREIFRSVGVGAEFDEPTNQISNINYNMTINDRNEADVFFNDQSDDQTKHFDNQRHYSSEIDQNAETISNEQQDIPMTINLDEESAFRAVVEIDCALHLPKTEEANNTIEPSTYVTFQKVRNNITDRIGADMIRHTNIISYSCNPKYNWRGDTELSTDLLTKEDKRLIMKVWRVINPKEKMEMNLEKDVVIGFSAIDLSVLTAGFPMVSGWFHIIDFAGKCNGQLKVNVTPVDNIATLRIFNPSTLQSNIPITNQSTNCSPYPEIMQKTNKQDDQIESSKNSSKEVPAGKPQSDSEPIIDIGFGLGDASMSFLSQSLKQKLSELDEIKKRLQSRLQHVTSTAFDDDFENDFDLVEHDYERDNNDKNGNDDDNESMESVSWLQQPIAHYTTTNSSIVVNNCFNNVQPYSSHAASVHNALTVETSATDTGYSTCSNAHSEHILANGAIYSNSSHDRQTNVSKSIDIVNGKITERVNSDRNVNGHDNTYDSRKSHSNTCDYQLDQSKSRQYKNTDVNSQITSEQNTDLSETMTDNKYVKQNVPIQGTRVHINHLLDKLSTQLSAAPPPITNIPMKRNIMDLISSLRRNNNNFSNDIKCNREANIRTIPTQTDVNYANDLLSPNNSIDHINNGDLPKNEGETPAKSQKTEKISTVIRDELVSDDHNDSIDYDYLSTRLMTSNIRHMAMDHTLNPLLYQHILPDIFLSQNELQNNGQHNLTSPSVSPEGEAVEQLDSRYVETFNASLSKGLNRLQDITEMESTSAKVLHQHSSSLNNAETFRVTPTGISENADGNIDVTVIHTPYNDDLMASNSFESTTTLSIGNDVQTVTEIDDNSSLNSSDTSVSVVSRQAPDGGNPAEDPGKLFTTKHKNHLPNSSSSDS